jgi:uncharacterized protein (TIGR03086 family)
MDPIERIEGATAFASEKIQGVTTGDMSKPTPCSEFDVRTLLNHVVGNLGMLTAAAEGGKPGIPKGDQFGSDPAGAYSETRTALLSALGAQGVLDRNWEMPFGSLPGSMMASIAFIEHLTHGWDLAKATGQDTRMPTDLVADCTEVATPMDSMLRMPGVCGPAISVAADASPQDKLISFLGRTP